MKMELILVLLHNPSILFLDEPTLGLDILSQKKLRSFIKEYNKEHMATMVITSHNMRDVEELCDRVIVIDHGTIIYDGNRKELYSYHQPHEVENLDNFEETIARLLEGGQDA